MGFDKCFDPKSTTLFIKVMISQIKSALYKNYCAVFVLELFVVEANPNVFVKGLGR